jgi:sucrose-6-phosphate hydrolase SacC (GH32 family)
VCGVPVVCDLDRRVLACGNAEWPLPRPQAANELEILVDRNMIDVFAGGGAVYLPYAVLLKQTDHDMRLFAENGDVIVEDLNVEHVRSIWSRTSRTSGGNQ